MAKDQQERRMYRRSPGRQYGYEYDPLRSRSGKITGTRSSEALNGREETGSRSGILLAQRPDPRRTRQLLRQRIIASKVHELAEKEEAISPETDELARRHPRTSDDLVHYTPASRRARPRRTESVHLPPHLPSTRKLMEEYDEENELAPLDIEADPDVGYDDLAEDEYIDHSASGRSRRSVVLPPAVPSRQGSTSLRSPVHRTPPSHDFEDEDYDDAPYEEEVIDEDEYEEMVGKKAGRPRKKRGKWTRRGVLLGLGAATAAGAGIAAYQLAPRVPQIAGDVGANVQRQIEDAFNKGVAQGAESARKELLMALDNLEGFTLDGAMAAAKLTRVAYDVFISPVIQAGASIAGNFLSAMYQAFKTARGMLAAVRQDNQTLAAIEKILKTWEDQVTHMPKQLNTITQTDLDGAQAYLRALKRKLEEEKAKLTQPQGTATPKANTTPTPKK
ncbi:hypothetical protein EI42_04587 [Thermosporothrix hazakensis]|uniref:Uncharacterized protein n=1 Tax=Thermosporothrix hazakensis TaxID=644383 RepID=A0A326UAH3_THEHA|nr:hypothetical protein [Thermosporothrix hazakensis]PZW24705.1 hypothetical protein EI42_04587 [Thermosporothrix hazakensis]GCE48349.1 hypothetical protein KTH_32180 [Thermosporothrix hazakensis]